MVYNFSAGPATVYREVLKKIQRELVDYKGMGYSLLEASHRGKIYDEVHNHAISLLLSHMGLGDEFQVLFLGGGGTLQFAMLAYNFLQEGRGAGYINTGTWAQLAIKDAQKVGRVTTMYDGIENGYTAIPSNHRISFPSDSSYIHLTSNETIGGIQWSAYPSATDRNDIPLVVDMSSDILSRTLDYSQCDYIYAGAQKNLGVSGVSVVVIKKQFLAQAKEQLPTYLSLKAHAQKNSLLNTPPVYAIWVLEQVFLHMKELGGVEKIEALNNKKASLLYGYIDGSDGFYSSSVDKESRSKMNVVFRLPTEALEQEFLQGCEEKKLLGLKGHRSVGGCRASLYNAMSVEGVAHLVEHMNTFKSTH